jgi:hypothetical protein
VTFSFSPGPPQYNEELRGDNDMVMHCIVHFFVDMAVVVGIVDLAKRVKSGNMAGGRFVVLQCCM